MSKWTVITETTGCTVRRTYEVESDTKPTSVDDLSGSILIETESDDYDFEEIESVEGAAK